MRLLRLCSLLVLWLLVAGPAGAQDRVAQGPVEVSRAEALVSGRELHGSVELADYQGLYNAAQTRDAEVVDVYLAALLTGQRPSARSRLSDFAIGINTFETPLVVLVGIGGANDILMVRELYYGGYADPDDLNLGRVESFWAVYVVDRLDDLSHSVQVEFTREIADRARALFQPPTADQPLGPATEADEDSVGTQEITLGIKRFTLPFAGVVEVDFLSRDRFTSEQFSVSRRFRALRTSRLNYGFAFSVPMSENQFSVGTRPVFLIGYVGFRELVRGVRESGQFSRYYRWISYFMPDFAVGIGLPAEFTYGSRANAYAFGFHWDVTPDGVLGVDLLRTTSGEDILGFSVSPWKLLELAR